MASLGYILIFIALIISILGLVRKDIKSKNWYIATLLGILCINAVISMIQLHNQESQNQLANNQLDSIKQENVLIIQKTDSVKVILDTTNNRLLSLIESAGKNGFGIDSNNYQLVKFKALINHNDGVQSINQKGGQTAKEITNTYY